MEAIHMVDSAQIHDREVFYLSWNEDEQKVKETSHTDDYISLIYKLGPIGTNNDHVPIGTWTLPIGTQETEKDFSDWGELKAPKIELKTLPVGLRYVDLGMISTYPIIIKNVLKKEEVGLLLCTFRKYRKAFG